MPTYEYECSGCGHCFDMMQSMNDDRLTKCPKCGKMKLERLIGSGAGIIFKGSGFYETDYKRKSPLPCGAKECEVKKDKKTDKKESSRPNATACGCNPSACAHAS